MFTVTCLCGSEWRSLYTLVRRKVGGEYAPTLPLLSACVHYRGRHARISCRSRCVHSFSVSLRGTTASGRFVGGPKNKINRNNFPPREKQQIMDAFFFSPTKPFGRLSDSTPAGSSTCMEEGCDQRSRYVYKDRKEPAYCAKHRYYVVPHRRWKVGPECSICIRIDTKYQVAHMVAPLV